MIRKIHIQNFKSLADFEMELGRVNVIVGANGSGKTNILEGILMGATLGTPLAAITRNSLGELIRLTAPEFMTSAFTSNKKSEIKIKFELDNPNRTYDFDIVNEGGGDLKWWDRNGNQGWIILNRLNADMIGRNPKDESEAMKRNMVLEQMGLERKPGESVESQTMRISKAIEDEQTIFRQYESLVRFLIYAPENTFLRKFEDPSQLFPLGIRGEGLFQELKRIFTDRKKKKQQDEIKHHLQLLDWFEDVEIPKGLLSMEHRMAIKDRFLDPNLAAFDQRSANEGFLMLLFYLVLFISEDTPRFFAIENIDSAFNPRLCWEIMSLLAKLAAKHDKQFIVTTHNSSTLNGLDLKNDEERLFVASRNSKGHTRVQRIKEKPQSGILLSELWTKGYIGGMPDNL